MENSINERIKLLIQSSPHKTVNAFSKAHNIPQTTLNDCVTKGKEPKFGLIAKIANASPLIDLNWLLTGKGHMLKGINTISEKEGNIERTTLSNQLEFSADNKGIPFYADLPVSAGESGLAEISLPEVPTGYMSIPNIYAEYLFPVIGCSMLPKIKAGDIIGANLVHRWDRVEPDKLYLIVTTDERMIKRLRTDDEDKNILWCISDNYDKFKIYKSEIKAIYHVVWHGEML